MMLTNENTAIVLDSSADLPDGRFPNVRVVPLYVHFGETTLRDGLDLSPKEFYERLRVADELPTTSQPTPRDFADVYAALASEGYERIWSLHLSGALSGTVRSAELAASDRGDDLVRVVDTGTVSLAVAQLALAIRRRLDRGCVEAALDELLSRFREARVVFTLETLEFLQKGGRIGKAQALVGSLLNIRPILGIEGGVVVPLGRVRGQRKALDAFRGELERHSDPDSVKLRVAIAHADAPAWIDDLTEIVTSVRPSATIELVSHLGIAVGTHAGPGTAGLFWVDDPD